MILSKDQLEELDTIVAAGPDLEKDSVVRWRAIDLKRVIEARFGVGRDFNRLNFPAEIFDEGGEPIHAFRKRREAALRLVSPARLMGDRDLLIGGEEPLDRIAEKGEDEVVLKFRRRGKPSFELAPDRLAPKGLAQRAGGILRDMDAHEAVLMADHARGHRSDSPLPWKLLRWRRVIARTARARRQPLRARGRSRG